MLEPSEKSGWKKNENSTLLRLTMLSRIKSITTFNLNIFIYFRVCWLRTTQFNERIRFREKALSRTHNQKGFPSLFIQGKSTESLPERERESMRLNDMAKRFSLLLFNCSYFLVSIFGLRLVIASVFFLLTVALRNASRWCSLNRGRAFRQLRSNRKRLFSF